jgi:hypothetical protein
MNLMEKENNKDQNDTYCPESLAVADGIICDILDIIGHI